MGLGVNERPRGAFILPREVAWVGGAGEGLATLTFLPLVTGVGVGRNVPAVVCHLIQVRSCTVKGHEMLAPIDVGIWQELLWARL